jgi:hypothetical protein
VRLETALAVPVFSGKSSTPAFIFSVYSFVRSGTVPFVLKFVQQALRLLWKGLDKVQPHSSVGDRIWNDLEPADLGEMAADVEMQQHFMRKKRPHHDIIDAEHAETSIDGSLGEHFESMQGPSGVPSVRSIYTGSGSSAGLEPSLEPINTPFQEQAPLAPVYQYESFQSIQGHLQNAVRSIGNMKPVHQSVATNEQGSKRAHVYMPSATPRESQYEPSFNQSQSESRSTTPLTSPRPLAAPGRVLVNPESPGRMRQEYPYQYQDQSIDNTAQHQQHQAPVAAAQHQQHQAPVAAAMPPPSQQPQTLGIPQNYAYQQPHATAPVLTPEQSTMSSIPKNQISATGISFPIPVNSTMNGMQTSEPAQNAAPVNSAQYCMPAAQPMPPAKVNGNGKVSPSVTFKIAFLSVLFC